MGIPNPRLSVILEEYQNIKRRYSEAGSSPTDSNITSQARPSLSHKSYSDLTESFNARQRLQLLELLKEERSESPQKQQIMLSNKEVYAGSKIQMETCT